LMGAVREGLKDYIICFGGAKQSVTINKEQIPRVHTGVGESVSTKRSSHP